MWKAADSAGLGENLGSCKSELKWDCWASLDIICNKKGLLCVGTFIEYTVVTKDLSIDPHAPSDSYNLLFVGGGGGVPGVRIAL